MTVGSGNIYLITIFAYKETYNQYKDIQGASDHPHHPFKN